MRESEAGVGWSNVFGLLHDNVVVVSSAHAAGDGAADIKTGLRVGRPQAHIAVVQHAQAAGFSCRLDVESILRTGPGAADPDAGDIAGPIESDTCPAIVGVLHTDSRTGPQCLKTTDDI